MKYITVIIDGVADYPLEVLGGKTPLEYANTPALDSMAPFSWMGMARTIPEGMSPGSDTANLSVMGFDPRRYHTGRSPLEAVSLGIKLSPEDLVFRCNLVTLSEEADYASRTMIDYSAGEIPGAQSRVIIEDLKKELATKAISFHAGVSYRHVMVWKGGRDEVSLTPPHDILDRKIEGYLPSGQGSDVLLDLMVRSSRILKNHPVNIKRIKEGKRPANSIWLWGQGRKPALDNFYNKYGLKGAVISAVDLIRGIGISAGLEVVEVSDITGTIDSNFPGKAKAAVDTLAGGRDFVYVHLEATDECSHQGNIESKVKAIEIIDMEVIGKIKKSLEEKGIDFRMLVMPDHPTPIKLRTHTAEPVPFMIYDSRQPDVEAGRTVKAGAAAVEAGETVEALETVEAGRKVEAGTAAVSARAAGEEAGRTEEAGAATVRAGSVNGMESDKHIRAGNTGDRKPAMAPVLGFNEKSAVETGVYIEEGYELADYLFGRPVEEGC